MHRQNEGITEKENICNGIYINVVCFGFSAAKDCKAWEGNMLRRVKRMQKLTKHSRFMDLCYGAQFIPGSTLEL